MAGCEYHENEIDSSQPAEKKLKIDFGSSSQLLPLEEEVKPTEAKDDHCYNSDDEIPDEYYDQVLASDGFDVDILPKYYPKSIPFGYILPLHGVKSTTTLEPINELSDLAIKHYNDQNNANYKFVKIVKANSEVCCGINYYITLEADDDVGQTKIFQALVARGIEENEVLICRLKHTD